MDATETRQWNSDSVAADLERAIHEHRLPPATKLGEDELGEAYGISRTVVRAALHALSHRRLVELRRNRGAFVAQPSVREAREVFEARALLEPRTAPVRAAPTDGPMPRPGGALRPISATTCRAGCPGGRTGVRPGFAVRPVPCREVARIATSRRNRGLRVRKNWCRGRR